eukprot:jgi/Botrbrau1/13902/Bobra.0017s0009.1
MLNPTMIACMHWFRVWVLHFSVSPGTVPLARSEIALVAEIRVKLGDNHIAGLWIQKWTALKHTALKDRNVALSIWELGFLPFEMQVLLERVKGSGHCKEAGSRFKSRHR